MKQAKFRKLTDPLVTVIMMSHNQSKFIDVNMTSLLNQTCSNYQVYFADSHSTDDTLKLISKYKDPRLTIFSFKRNLGPTTIWNKLIKNIKTKYVILLNTSANVSSDFIEKMIVGAEKMGATFGGATPKMLNYLPPHSPFQMVKHPLNSLSSVVLTIVNKIIYPFHPRVGTYLKNEIMETRSYWGAACILSTDLLKKMKFDNILFAFGDESDIVSRAVKFGYRFFCFPSTSVKYFQGSSSTTTEGNTTPIRAYLSIRNKIYLDVKNGELYLAPLYLIDALLLVFGYLIYYPHLYRYILEAIKSSINLLPLALKFKLWGHKYYDKHNFSWERDKFLKSLVAE